MQNRIGQQSLLMNRHESRDLTGSLKEDSVVMKVVTQAVYDKKNKTSSIKKPISHKYPMKGTKIK